MNRGKIPAHLIKKSTPIGRVGFMFLDEESIDYEFQKELGEYQCSLFIHSDHIGTLKDDIDELLETTAKEVRSNQQIFKSDAGVTFCSVHEFLNSSASHFCYFSNGHINILTRP